MFFYQINAVSMSIKTFYCNNIMVLVHSHEDGEDKKEQVEDNETAGEQNR